MHCLCVYCFKVTTTSTNKTSKEYITQVQTGTHRNNDNTHEDDDSVENENIPTTEIKSKNSIHYFEDYTPQEQKEDIPAPSYDISIIETQNNFYNTMINSRAPHKVQFELEEDLGSDRTASRPSSIQESQSSRKSLTKK
jgi:hypothetical protein